MFANADSWKTIFETTSNIMSLEISIRNNEKELRFETADEVAETAYLEYQFYKGNLALVHTLVPESRRGKGIASALAAYAFRYAAGQNKKVMVYCGFVAGYVKRHPELKAQLNKEYHP